MDRQKNIFLVVVVLLSMAVFVRADDKPGITLDVTYVSRYLDKGFECYPENHSGIQYGIDIDLYGTGFGLKVIEFRANSSNFENGVKRDYRVYYAGRFFEDSTYVTNYKVTWMYHSFINQPRSVADNQELETAFWWPNILPGGLVPSYVAALGWPAKSNAANRNMGGWAHIFGLSRDLVIPSLEDQVFHLSAIVVYNDGVGPGCGGRGPTSVDHDFSHAVFSVSTEYDISANLTFTPGLYYQSSWDDSVNTQDEYWVSLGMSYKF